MKKFCALSAVALLSMPMAALAGGTTAPAVEPVVVPVVAVDVTPDWTGFYAGAALGFGNVSSNAVIEGIDLFDGNGGMGGIMAGYRYDFGQFVLGVEGDYNWGSIGVGEEYFSGIKIDSLSHIKLQAGADVGQAFIYGTAGWAWGNLTDGTDDISMDGSVFGIGTDYAVTDKWTVGGEILWNQFNNVEDSGIDFDVTTFNLRAGYRF